MTETYIKKIQKLLTERTPEQVVTGITSKVESVRLDNSLFSCFIQFHYSNGEIKKFEVPLAISEAIIKDLKKIPELSHLYQSEATSKEKQNQQVCAHLEVEDFYTTSKDTLGDLMELQKDIQEKVYGYDFAHVQSTLGTVKEFIDWNYAADQDEWRELYNALGGVDSHGSAVWKPWKSRHKEALAKPFSELSESEKKELHMEIVDRFHFFLNICLATGLDAKTLFNYYYAKNKENRERQKRVGGY